LSELKIILYILGPKVAGTPKNEVLAFGHILRAVFRISEESESQNITIDHQLASGHNTNYSNYRNLQNIVVKLNGNSDHAVMLNCHFDSVAGSPGASDDIVMCCVMIEVLRILSKQTLKLEHSVIFLFNGCEEQGLHAAHGFITQHRWAKQIQCFINLESTGSGGRELLFRSGPKHDWLVRMYHESSPHPFGQSLAEELYETGILQGRTDFQIFRDDGEIPGLDFAYVDDGWRYHTRYDSIDYITRESVQYTGENILALTKQIANSQELYDPPEGDYAIYFDYLGLFFISYTRITGIILNIVVSIVAIILPFIIQSKMKIASNFCFVLMETLLSFITIVISIVASAGVCYLIAIIMNSLDNTMSWFNTIFISIGIYGCAAVITQILVYHIIQLIREKCRSKESEAKYPEDQRMQVHFNGVNLFWALITLTTTAMGYRFGYITMIILLFSIVSNLLVSLCFIIPARFHSWIVFHILGHSFSYMFTSYIWIQLWELFLPIAGKQYYENPDILVALICVFGTVLCFSYFVCIKFILEAL
jgi:uncharacterized protein (DUF433 family)